MPAVILCHLATCRALTRADRAYSCGRLRFCSAECLEKHKATVYRNRAARARFKARQKAAQPVVLVEAPEPLPAPPVHWLDLPLIQRADWLIEHGPQLAEAKEEA